MSFKLKVKSNTSAPVSGALDIGELGYNTNADQLFVGNGAGLNATPVIMALEQTNVADVSGVQLNYTNPAAASLARMAWNSVYGTAEIGLLNGVVQQIGEEIFFYGKASAAITNGQGVQFAGVEGDHILIKPSVAAEITANPDLFIGIATQDITLGNFGYITWFGYVHNIDTVANGYTLGAKLYVNTNTGAVNGSLTMTKPTADLGIIQVAAVVKEETGSANNGTLLVRITQVSRVISEIAGLQAALDGKAASSHTHDDRYYTETEIQNNTISMRNLTVNANGVPTNNLGSPSVAEMALFQEQFNNKTEFYDITKLTFETFDGTTWNDITSTISDANKKALMGGDGSSSLSIPNGATKYRITIRANTYVYINALYMYWSSNGNSSLVHIWKKHDSGAWTQHTNSGALVNSWPGHLYLPFATIPWHSTGTLGTHFHEIRVEFTPTWSHATNVISLHKMQWWGGYPAGKRTIYSVDYDKVVTFPNTVKVGSNNVIIEGDSRLTNSRPASDVYSWAKAATKPTYTYSEVGAAAASHTQDWSTITSTPTTLSGYGITDAINTSSTAQTKTGNLTVAGLSHSGLTMTTGTNIDQVKSITTSSLSLSGGSWTDIGVAGTYLATGSYILSMTALGETYTAQFSWYSGTTSSSVADEIILHRAGPSGSAARIYLRVLRVSSGTLKMQASASTTVSTSLSLSFRRLI